MDYQSLIALAPWTLIAQICNLLIQVYLFKRFLFKPVKNIIAKRKEEIDAIYSNASDAETAANNAKAEYEGRIAAAKEEAAEITKEATEQARARSDEMILNAKKEAAAIKEKASHDIELERKKAANDMKDEISSIAVSIATKVTQKEINKKEHEALIEEFIEGLGDEV